MLFIAFLFIVNSHYSYLVLIFSLWIEIFIYSRGEKDAMRRDQCLVENGMYLLGGGLDLGFDV